MQRVVLEHTVMVRCTCKIHEIIGFFQLQYSTFTVICHSVFSRDNGPCLFLGAHIWPLAALYICHEFPSSYMFSLTLPPQDTAGNNRSVGLTFLYQKLMASVMISVNWPGYVKCAHTVPFSVLFLHFCLHTIMWHHCGQNQLEKYYSHRSSLSYLTLLNIVIFIWPASRSPVITFSMAGDKCDIKMNEKEDQGKSPFWPEGWYFSALMFSSTYTITSVMKLLFSILFENPNMLLALFSMRNGKSLELGRKLFSCLVTHCEILKFFSVLQCNKPKTFPHTSWEKAGWFLLQKSQWCGDLASF